MAEIALSVAGRQQLAAYPGAALQQNDRSWLTRDSRTGSGSLSAPVSPAEAA